MSVVAKILVVLNLFLAVGFLGASATFLGVQENYKVQLKETSEKMQGQIDDLNALKDKLGGDLANQRQMSADFRASNEGLKATAQAKEAEALRNSEVYNQLLGQHEKLAQTYTDAVSTIDNLTADKKRLIEEKDGALAEKRGAVDAKNNAITEQKRLENEILGQSDQIAELEKRLTGTADKLENTELVVALYVKKFGHLGDIIGPPAIAAVVAGVNTDLNIVLLSVGRDDKVKEGFEFTIYRNNEYVATVVVDKVEKDHCSGYSKKEVERLPISVGDKGTTRF